MRILFTGATSFTGAWFARELASAGHAVIAAVRGEKAGYEGLRSQRLAMIHDTCEFRWGKVFGSDDFLTMLSQEHFDLFCHHAADATNYKSPDFDALGAAQANTQALRQVLAALKRNGCGKILLTGSAFEANEGAGTTPLRAFSPYGLSKSLTSSMFAYYAQQEGMGLGKFVIANPFGPLEEPRFTDYLLRCWYEGKAARVNTPDYVRDNIPISLLALAYADFAQSLPAAGFHRLNPSFYVESQGAFARRFSREIGDRLNLEALLDLAQQVDFSEPMIRINTDRISVGTERWQESRAWDVTAEYYRNKFAPTRRT